MKFVKGLLYTLVALVALFLIVAIFLPKESKMEFTIDINAPADIVFTQVNSLQNWEHWSPFTENMVNMKSTYKGPTEGVGNQHIWKSDKENGEMKIVVSESNKHIETALDFYENGQGKGYWNFAENNGQTHVVWGFIVDDLDYPVARWVGLFFDKMMAPIFNKGLNNLKSYCESKEAWVGIQEIDYPATPVIYINKSVKFSELGTFFGEAFGQLGVFMQKNQLQILGNAPR